MNMTLSPHPIGGRIAAIASKSQAHRLLICAALAWQSSKILCSESSEDIDATIRCLAALGADFAHCGETVTVYPMELPRGDRVLDCGESGSTLRFLLPVVGALGVGATFRLHGRLAERPLSPLWEEMERHGCRLFRPTPDTLRCEGRLSGGTYEIAGNVSSQFISGLLFALPLTGEDSDIMLTSNVESANYISMTLSALADFGVEVETTASGWHIPSGTIFLSPGKLAVEGDWSNAAFWLCAGAISTPVTVTGLQMSSLQADREILDILRRFGAEITITQDGVTAAPAELHGIEIDARNIPDLVPPIAAVAACARGKTTIYGAERLKIKESNRLQSVADAIRAVGGQVEITSDGLIITGSALRGGRIDSCNDHRIAMLAGILSSICSQPITLIGADAVKKSYPRFWEDLKSLSKS